MSTNTTTTSTTTARTRSYRNDNIAMIGMGTLLLLLTLFILTLFNNDLFGIGRTSAAALTNTSAATKARVPELLLVPSNQSAQNIASAQLSEADQLRAAVERANRAFIEGRASGNSAVLAPVATGAWLAQEQGYLGAMRGRGQTERWNLISLEYLQIVPKGNTAFVCTRETWEYSIINANGVATPLRRVVMTEGYYLTRTANGWIVNRIDIGS